MSGTRQIMCRLSV